MKCMADLINGRTPEGIKDTIARCTTESTCRLFECPYSESNDCNGDLLRDALALIEHLEAQQPKWISVEERLPERECLAIGWQDEMLIGNVYRSGAGYACESDGEYLMDVTHWMPLPEPPKEENV